MENKRLTFRVTVCLGWGDGGDVDVRVSVTPDEFELLKECYREGIEIEDCTGLKRLYDTICEYAEDEDIACGCDEDHSDASYMVHFPKEIIEAKE